MSIKQYAVISMMAVGVAAANPRVPASSTNGSGVPTQMVITVRPASGGQAAKLEAQDLTVLEGGTRAPVIQMERLTGDMADMQLFVLLDDSTRSSSLGVQLPELKTFLRSLPGTTQVAVGYMRNGSFALAQSFTSDHEKTASALRLPMAMAGENGSPYFALSSLVDHWPSRQSRGRRAILMLTDGVDRYYSDAIIDDPYVDVAIHRALKEGVTVYSIYLRGAGAYSRNGWVTNVAQSRLIEVSEQTGGYAYSQGFSDPVTISPFLKDLQNRFENQYRVTIMASNEKGSQSVKLRTELPRLKIDGPTRIYVR
jgi:hypothetical protein